MIITFLFLYTVNSLKFLNSYKKLKTIKKRILKQKDTKNKIFEKSNIIKKNVRFFFQKKIKDVKSM